MDKIAQASAAVEALRVSLQAELAVVEQKKAETQALIESIGQEKGEVDAAAEAGRGDEDEAAALQAEVTAVQAECTSDLAAAEPVIRVGYLSAVALPAMASYPTG